MKRKNKFGHRHKGQNLAGKAIRAGGKSIARIIHQGKEAWPNGGVSTADVDARFQTLHRIVEDDSRRWFEMAFVADRLFQGDAENGWSDEDGYVYVFPQYSEDLVAWSNTGFAPAPVPVVAHADGRVEHWSRAKLPVNATPKTGALVSFSTDANGDARNNPFTAITIGGAVQSLPNFPYTMPGDAAQLQTDLVAAGWAGTTVAAASDVDWQITIPDVDIFGFQNNSRVSWAPYTVPSPFGFEDTTISGRSFVGDFIDVHGNRVVERAFGRFAVMPGTRYGTPAQEPLKNPTFADLSPLLPPSTTPPPSGGITGPSPPYLAGGQSLLVTGTHAPGATLTRPSLTWTNPHTSEMIVTGEWHKNGTPTGEAGPTYSDTADGDLIQYIESAANDIGTGGGHITWPRFAVSLPAVVHTAEMHDALAPLIVGKAGAAHMDVFSTANHTAPTYVRNAGLWAASLATQLAACAAWKTHSRESYGGVLITPRHVLYCNHAHPHAAGTWIYPKATEIVRFVKTDGTVIPAVQICQTDYTVGKPGYIDPAEYPPGKLDLCVATLDRDMTLDGIFPIPIPLIRSREEYLAIGPTGAPRLAVGQGTSRPTVMIPPAPISDYPQYHQAMCYLRTLGGSVADAPYDLLDYRVWDGDSGTPTFLLHRGQLYLDGILVSTPWGRVPVPLHVARLNQMIAASDAGAVAMGRLAEPTGLTLTAVPLPVD